MKAAILQSNYIPWKGYFDIINDVDIFCFYDEVKYTKNDWRNRNKIYPKSGIQWLTIPISKEAVKIKVSEVKIADKKWQDLHYKTLSFSYRNAPYFEQLRHFMDELYLDKKWEFLSVLNQHSIKLISEFIGIKTKFLDSSELNIRGNRVEKLINILKDLGANEYISGPAAKAYLSGNEHLFEENGIILKYKDYSGYKTYTQLAEPFEHSVSIFDMLANIEANEINNHIWGHNNK
jgi:WbqC-like protein family